MRRWVEIQDTPWIREQKIPHEQGWAQREREMNREMYEAYNDDCVKPVAVSHSSVSVFWPPILLLLPSLEQQRLIRLAKEPCHHPLPQPIQTYWPSWNKRESTPILVCECYRGSSNVKTVRAPRNQKPKTKKSKIHRLQKLLSSFIVIKFQWFPLSLPFCLLWGYRLLSLCWGRNQIPVPFRAAVGLMTLELRWVFPSLQNPHCTFVPVVMHICAVGYHFSPSVV